MMQTPLDFALSYIEKGWEVLPLNWITDSGCSCGRADCSSPGKHPYARLVPRGLKDATTNPQMLRDWWGVVPKLNVGIATGEASGLVVLDIDPKNGGDEGAKLLAERYGSFAGTATVSTGSGGRHYYFHHPGFSVRNTAGSLAKGVDTRGEGGYVVSPPSNHLSGNNYEWESEELMPMPAWISSSERPSMSGAPRVLGEMIPRGVQHKRLVSIAGSMRRRGLTAEEIGPSLIVVSKRCEEVPPEDHVWRIARSVEKYPPGDAGRVDFGHTPSESPREVDGVQLPPLAGPLIPQVFYDGLHDDINRVCLCFDEGRERDVFITGFLPVASAAMPNVRTKYAKQWKAPALSTAIIAPAGSGKSAMSVAGDCAEKIDARLRQTSADERAYWAGLGDEERKSKPQPPERALRLSIDASSRGLLDAMVANGGRGLVFETEMIVAVDTLKQDWGGGVKPILLKSAEQEPLERLRKGEDKLFIRKPELPMAISGTPEGFFKWIRSAEDGLLSRLLCYAFEAPPVWVDQFGDDDDDKLDLAVNRVSERLDKMHEALSGRKSDKEGKPIPLFFRFDKEQKARLNAAFAYCLQAADVSNRTELFAAVKRGALHAVRIAAVLAAYRIHVTKGDLGTRKSYTANDAEVNAAIALVYCYLDHASAISLRFENDPRSKLKSEEQWKFYERLPSDEFSTAHALECGILIDISERGVERALSRLTAKELLVKTRHGHYRKARSNPPALAEVSEMSEPRANQTQISAKPPKPTVPPTNGRTVELRGEGAEGRGILPKG